MFREVGYFFEDHGISPIQLGIGLIVGLGIGAYEVHTANGIIDQSNIVIRQQNGRLDQLDFEIRKGNVYGAMQQAEIDQLNRNIESWHGYADDLNRRINEADLATKPINYSVSQDLTRTSLDVEEGNQITILGNKFKVTKEGFVTTNSSGEEQTFPLVFTIGPKDHSQERYTALLTKTPTTQPNRYTVIITGMCVPPAPTP